MRPIFGCLDFTQQLMGTVDLCYYYMAWHSAMCKTDNDILLVTWHIELSTTPLHIADYQLTIALHTNKPIQHNNTDIIHLCQDSLYGINRLDLSYPLFYRFYNLWVNQQNFVILPGKRPAEQYDPDEMTRWVEDVGLDLHMAISAWQDVCQAIQLPILLPQQTENAATREA